MANNVLNLQTRARLFVIVRLIVIYDTCTEYVVFPDRFKIKDKSTTLRKIFVISLSLSLCVTLHSPRLVLSTFCRPRAAATLTISACVLDTTSALGFTNRVGAAIATIYPLHVCLMQLYDPSLGIDELATPLQ